MKTQTIKITATGEYENVAAAITLTTKRQLAPSELKDERKVLTDHLCEALRKYGPHYQDMRVK